MGSEISSRVFVAAHYHCLRAVLHQVVFQLLLSPKFQRALLVQTFKFPAIVSMSLVQVHADYLLTRIARYFKLAEHLLEHTVHLALYIVLSTQGAFFIPLVQPV
jgi:hypothetical protein